MGMLAVSAGLLSAPGFAMPTPAAVDAVGRSSDWMLIHGLGTTPKIAAGREVNGTQGRASALARTARPAGALKSVTVEPRSVGVFGRA